MVEFTLFCRVLMQIYNIRAPLDNFFLDQLWFQTFFLLLRPCLYISHLICNTMGEAYAV